MKNLSCHCLLLSTLLVPAAIPAAEPVPGPAEIDPIIAEAARYESGKSMQPLRQLEALARQSATRPQLRKNLEPRLLKLLGPDSTFEARRFACQQLAIVGSDAALPAIADLLKNPETAGIATLALTTFPSPKANAVLRDALPAGRGIARVQIINTLGDRQDQQAAALLADDARSPDPLLADAAIAALGKIANPRALEILAELRQSSNPATASAAIQPSLLAAGRLASDKRSKAAAALYEVLLQPSHPAYVQRAALEGLLRLDADDGEKRIQASITGIDPALVPSLIAGIRSLRSKNASARFAALLPNLRPAEQVLLIEALAARGDAAARSAIAENISAQDPAVRRAAITALGKTGDPTAAPVLVQAIANARSGEESLAAEQALVGLKGANQTDQVLIRELQSAAPPTKARLITVLAKRDARAAIPALLETTTDPACAGAAFQGLGKLAGPDDLPVLVEKLVHLKVPEARADAESAVAQALARTTDAVCRAQAVCGALGRATDLDTRVSLLRLMPACGCAKALAAVQAARADSQPRIRDAAVRALADWPDAAAWDALANIYRQPETETHRALVLRAQVRLTEETNARLDAQCLERYRQLLAGAKTDEDRKLILGALAGAAHPDALPLALPLLANPGVRAEAALAVKKIAEAIQARYPDAARQAFEQLKTAK